MSPVLRLSCAVLALALLVLAVSGQTTPAQYGTFVGGNSGPFACFVQLDAQGFLYVSVSCTTTFNKYTANYTLVPSFGPQLSNTLAPLSAGLPTPIFITQMVITQSGLMWFYDEANYQVLAVSNTAAPTALTTILPLAAQNAWVGGLAVQPGTDNVWVVLSFQPQPLWLFSPQGAILAQLGPATTPALVNYFVGGIQIDAQGNLYISGTTPLTAFQFESVFLYEYEPSAIISSDIRVITANGTYLQTFNASSVYGDTPDLYAIGVSVVNGAQSLYAIDYVEYLDLSGYGYYYNSFVYEFDVATGAQVNTLPNAGFGNLAFSSSGDAFTTTDTAIQRLYAGNLSLETTVTILPTSSSSFNGDIGLAFSPDYKILYSSTFAPGIAAYNLSGYQIAALGASVLVSPQGLCTDAAGNLFVEDAGLESVVKLSPNGTYLATFKDPSKNYSFETSSSCAVNPVTGELVVTDEGNQRLVIFAPNGSVTLRVDTTQFSDPQSYPLDVVVTPTGTIIYADLYIVTEITSTGQFIRQFNVSAGGEPATLTLDPVYNRLFVGDVFAEVVYIFSLDGSQLGIPVTPSESVFEIGMVYSPLQQTLYVADYGSAIITFPIQPPITGVLPTSSLCAIFYGLPGSVDYPFSIATTLTFQYLPSLVTNSLGTAVQLVSGGGVRTYTNRFGAFFSTPLTLAQTGTGATDNLLYLQSAVPVDSGGLVFTLASPVQLPGAGTYPAYSTLTFFNQSGYIGEGASGRLDTAGQAFLSSFPGFRNVTIGASNINSLAANYATCSAPLTFTNGLRVPTQPSTANSAQRYRLLYSVSDGASYRVTGNLTLTAQLQFATTQDQLGSPYQTIVAVTGSLVYTHLPSSKSTTVTVTLLNSAPPGAKQPSQRFYPFSLLAAAPGVYSQSTAPFLDGAGLALSLNGSLPLLGAPPATGTQYTSTTLYVAQSLQTWGLAHTNAYNAPVLALQTQAVTLLM